MVCASLKRAWSRSISGQFRSVSGPFGPGPFGSVSGLFRVRFPRSPDIPEGLARHLDASRQKLTPHCLAAIFDSQLPSPRYLLKCLPNCLFPAREGIFPSFIGGSQKSGFQKGGFGGCSPGTKTGTRVRSPKPPFWKPPFYLPVTLFGGSQKGGFQKGGFGGCSPGTKTGTRVHSPKPPFYETALLSPSEFKIAPAVRVIAR